MASLVSISSTSSDTSAVLEVLSTFDVQGYNFENCTDINRLEDNIRKLFHAIREGGKLSESGMELAANFICTPAVLELAKLQVPELRLPSPVILENKPLQDLLSSIHGRVSTSDAKTEAFDSTLPYNERFLALRLARWQRTSIVPLAGYESAPELHREEVRNIASHYDAIIASLERLMTDKCRRHDNPSLAEVEAEEIPSSAVLDIPSPTANVDDAASMPGTPSSDQQTWNGIHGDAAALQDLKYICTGLKLRPIHTNGGPFGGALTALSTSLNSRLGGVMSTTLSDLLVVTMSVQYQEYAQRTISALGLTSQTSVSVYMNEELMSYILQIHALPRGIPVCLAIISEDDKRASIRGSYSPSATRIWVMQSVESTTKDTGTCYRWSGYGSLKSPAAAQQIYAISNESDIEPDHTHVQAWRAQLQYNPATSADAMREVVRRAFSGNLVGMAANDHDIVEQYISYLRVRAFMDEEVPLVLADYQRLGRINPTQMSLVLSYFQIWMEERLETYVEVSSQPNHPPSFPSRISEENEKTETSSGVILGGIATSDAPARDTGKDAAGDDVEGDQKRKRTDVSSLATSQIAPGDKQKKKVRKLVVSDSEADSQSKEITRDDVVPDSQESNSEGSLAIRPHRP